MEADPALQRSPASLYQIYVPSAGGGQVPLSAIAKFEERPEPLLINHLASSRPTRSPSTCRRAARSASGRGDPQGRGEIGMPASVVTSFQGAASAFESSLNNELFLILAPRS
jgi:multidrug efflux pump